MPCISFQIVHISFHTIYIRILYQTSGSFLTIDSFQLSPLQTLSNLFAASAMSGNPEPRFPTRQPEATQHRSDNEILSSSPNPSEPRPYELATRPIADAYCHSATSAPPSSHTSSTSAVLATFTVISAYALPAFCALWIITVSSIGITRIIVHRREINDKCPPAPGIPDMYGIGIRIATYAQFCLTSVMEYLAPEHTLCLALTNLFFLLAFVTGQLALASTESVAGPVDVHILNSLGTSLAVNLMLGDVLLPRPGYQSTRLIQLVILITWSIINSYYVLIPEMWPGGGCSYYILDTWGRVVLLPLYTNTRRDFRVLVHSYSLVYCAYQNVIWVFQMKFQISVISMDSAYSDVLREFTQKSIKRRDILKDMFFMFPTHEVDKIICGVYSIIHMSSKSIIV